MVNDTIGDFITRIRNAYIRGKKEIILPSSGILTGIAKILKDEKYIESFKNDEDEKKRKELKVVLKYKKNKPAVTEIKRISKPGVRIYSGFRDIPEVLNGLGIVILTTPKGIMTGKDAVKEKVGGELLCSLW